jgi:hypothetical protein
MTAPDPLGSLLPPNSLVETKVAIGSWAGIITGLIVWGLTYWIPAWHDGIPGPLLAFLPMGVAWLMHTAAAYLAPHTHRPDLLPIQTALTPIQGGKATVDVPLPEPPAK